MTPTKQPHPGCNVVDLTDAERDAVIGWAGMAAVGFSYGPPLDPKDPSISALAKINATKVA